MVTKDAMLWAKGSAAAIMLSNDGVRTLYIYQSAGLAKAVLTMLTVLTLSCYQIDKVPPSKRGLSKAVYIKAPVVRLRYAETWQSVGLESRQSGKDWSSLMCQCKSFSLEAAMASTTRLIKGLFAIPHINQRPVRHPTGLFAIPHINQIVQLVIAYNIVFLEEQIC